MVGNSNPWDPILYSYRFGSNVQDLLILMDLPTSTGNRILKSASFLTPPFSTDAWIFLVKCFILTSSNYRGTGALLRPLLKNFLGLYSMVSEATQLTHKGGVQGGTGQMTTLEY